MIRIAEASFNAGASARSSRECCDEFSGRNGKNQIHLGASAAYRDVRQLHSRLHQSAKPDARPGRRDAVRRRSAPLLHPRAIFLLDVHRLGGDHRPLLALSALRLHDGGRFRAGLHVQHPVAGELSRTDPCGLRPNMRISVQNAPIEARAG